MIAPRWLDDPDAADRDRRRRARAGRPRRARRRARARSSSAAPSVLSYRDMISRTASILGRRKPAVIRVPLLTPRLSSYWVALVTPVEFGLVRPLVDGLKEEMRRGAPAAGRDQRRAHGLRRRRPGGAAVKLLNRRAGAARRRRRDPRPRGAHGRSTSTARCARSRRADLTMPDARARGDLVADAPRAARAHLLEVPLARDARPDPRRLHADGARGRVHRATVRAAALPRARVRDGRRARDRPLADPRRDPRRLDGREGDGYLEIDVQRCPEDDPGRARLHVEVEIASFYPALVLRNLPLALREHAVAHPRARHARLPALARAARAGGVGGRPLRRPAASSTRRSTSATRRGPWSGRSPRSSRAASR